MSLFETTCHITRLPECLYYGKFSINYEDHFYNGETIKQLNHISLTDCSANCVMNDLCKFFNYNDSNQSCYLLQAEYYYVDLNNLVEKTGWTFWTTEYKPFVVRDTGCLKSFYHKTFFQKVYLKYASVV